MTKRLVAGVEPKEDFPSRPRFEELLEDGHLLISGHTRKYLKDEIYFPGPVLDRANRSRWHEEGKVTLSQRAHDEAARLIDDYNPVRLTDDIKRRLTALMSAEASKYGMAKLPSLE